MNLPWLSYTPQAELVLFCFFGYGMQQFWSPSYGNTSWTLPFSPHWHVGGVFLTGAGALLLGACSSPPSSRPREATATVVDSRPVLPVEVIASPQQPRANVRLNSRPPGLVTRASSR